VTGRSNHFTVVYNAGRAIGAEQPEALAYIALEFFERRDLFLISQESGMAFLPLWEELQAFKFDSRVRNGPRAEAGSGVQMSLATGHIDMPQRLGLST
jgi:hypothetical protein